MDENNVFLFGDDLNPTASEDSYNFGMA